MLVLLSLCSFISVTKNEHNATWMKIFHHYSGSGQYFANNSHALLSNQDGLFSIMGILDSSYQKYNLYEFLLEYPEFDGYNRWKQTLLPYDDIEKTGYKAIGYEPVYISWEGQFWGGLVRSSQSSYTTIDGSCGAANWFYSIGTINGEFWPNQFPGPALTNTVRYNVQEVLLWIRVDFIPQHTKDIRLTGIYHIFLLSFLYGF